MQHDLIIVINVFHVSFFYFPQPKEESIEFDYTDPMGSNEFGEREHSYYNSNGNGNSRISNNIDDVPTNHFEHQLITTVSSTISLTTERRTIPTTTSTTTTTTEGTTTTTQAPSKFYYNSISN